MRETSSGGTPYGASHVVSEHGGDLTADEKTLCRALGMRVAKAAVGLRNNDF